MAVSCGTPTPATMRVVQIEPGPMPTLTASAPASIRALAPSAVATLPAMIATALDSALDPLDLVETRLRMAVGGVDHHQSTPASISIFGALEAHIADGGGGGDAQAALAVLAGAGEASPFRCP